MTHLTEIQLNEYLDHALKGAAHRAAESHLRSCEACRARLDALQSLFADLSALPETRLSRDLTAQIIRRLPPGRPQRWTPAIAAQLGAAIGALLWLSVQVTKFALPMAAAGFHWPQLSLPQVTFSLPTLDPRLMPFDFLRFATSLLQPTFPELRLSFPELPAFRIPSFNLAQGSLSTLQLITIAISALLLWIVGNVSLLRGSSETRS